MAWQRLCKLQTRTSLIDESHYAISLRQCSICGQSFVSVFTETVDWADGEDHQYRTVMPLMEQEAGELESSVTNIERVLESLAPQRKTLRSDFAKGKGIARYWSHGIAIGPHD